MASAACKPAPAEVVAVVVVAVAVAVMAGALPQSKACSAGRGVGGSSGPVRLSPQVL